MIKLEYPQKSMFFSCPRKLDSAKFLVLLLSCSVWILESDAMDESFLHKGPGVPQTSSIGKPSPQHIQVIRNISELANMILPGDWIVLDIDNTLLRTGQGKRGPESTLLNLDPKVADLVKNLARSYPPSENGKEIKFLLLTERDNNELDETQQQLEKIGIPIQDVEILFDNPYEKEPQTAEKKLSKRIINSAYKPKRIFVIDDSEKNLVDIGKEFSSHRDLTQIPLKLFQKQFGYKLYESSDNGFSFPQDLDLLAFKKSIAGGSGGVHVLELNGQSYTFKCVNDTNQMKEEIAADAFYRALGIPVPAFAVYDILPKAISPDLCKGPGPYRLASYIDPGRQDPEKITQEIQKHFVADAFFGNWDIVVDNFKNVILDTAGKLWRVDNGGSLRYRAVAGKKDRDLLLKVNDLDTMRNPKINPYGSKAYGVLTKEELKLQAQQIFNNKEKLFNILDELDKSIHLENPKELKEILRIRLDDLAKRFQLVEENNLFPKSKNISPKNREALANSAAGILIYSQDPKSGEPVVLMGKRTRHNWWCNFGGGSDIDGREDPDQTLANTAVREVQEESLGLVSFTAQELSSMPSHDIINAKDKILYRMYTAPHPYVDRERFTKTPGTYKYHWTSEYDEYAWVPVSELLEGLKHPEITNEEGLETIVIGGRILFPPFWEMLKEPEVQNVLLSIIERKKPRPIHTHRESDAILPQHLSLEDEKHQLAETTVAHGAVMGEIKKGEAQLKPGGPTVIRNKYVEDTTKDEMMMVRKNFKAHRQNENKEENKEEGDAEEQIHGKGGFKIPTIDQETDHLDTIKRMAGYLPDDKAASLREQLRKTPYTQTQGYLAYRISDLLESLKGDSGQEVKTFLERNAHFKTSGDPHYRQVLTEALEEEKKPDNREKIVFYHASDPLSTFLFDIFTAYRSQLKMLPSNQLKVLRGLENSFQSVLDVEAFIEIFKDESGTIYNYSTKGDINYADVGLSVNPCLFGNDGVEKSATYHLFNTLSSAGAPDHEKLFNAFMASIGIPGHFKDYYALYQQYYMPEKNNNSKLYQIFIDPQVVDTVAYTAIIGGNIVDFPMDGGKPYHGFAKIIAELRTSPDSFNLTLHKSAAKGQIDINLLQGRLYLKPEVFHNPKHVTIKSYWRHDVPKNAETNYYKKLNAQVSQDLSGWLKSHQIEREGTFSEGHQALQKLYKNVYEGKTGLEFKEAERSPKVLLQNALTKADLKTVTKILKENKLDLNEKFQNLNYKVGSQKQSLISAADLIPGDAKDSWEIMKLFIESGFDPNVELAGNDPMLVKFGIKRNDLSAIKYLHKLGLKLDQYFTNNIIEFHGSPEECLEIVRLIVSNGIADPSSLILFAVTNDNLEIIKYLYDQKVVSIERIVEVFHLCYPRYNYKLNILKSPLDYFKFMHEKGGDLSKYVPNYIESGALDVIRLLFETYDLKYYKTRLIRMVNSFPNNENDFEKLYQILSEEFGGKIFVRVAINREYNQFILNLSNSIINELLHSEQAVNVDRYATLFQIITSDLFVKGTAESISSGCQKLLSKFESCKDQNIMCKNHYTYVFLLNTFINSIIKKEYSNLKENIKNTLNPLWNDDKVVLDKIEKIQRDTLGNTRLDSIISSLIETGF